MEDMIFGQLQTVVASADVAQRSAGVTFALRVSIVPPKVGKPSATGYEYKVVSHIDAESSDPMKQLEARVRESIKALPKPGETSADKAALASTPTPAPVAASGGRGK
jgi:hypothetical protein